MWICLGIVLTVWAVFAERRAAQRHMEKGWRLGFAHGVRCAQMTEQEYMDYVAEEEATRARPTFTV